MPRFLALLAALLCLTLAAPVVPVAVGKPTPVKKDKKKAKAKKKDKKKQAKAKKKKPASSSPTTTTTTTGSSTGDSTAPSSTSSTTTSPTQPAADAPASTIVEPASAPRDGAAPKASDLPLAVDAARFWAGATVASGHVRDESLCGTAAGPCFSWPLKVGGGGERLRVAIDTPMRSDTFKLVLIDPSGATAGSDTTSNTFDAEIFVTRPAAGTWTVKVVPQDVTDASFRLRAKLEHAVEKLTGKVALLPDLKAVPPLEMSFVAPLNPANGLYPPDTANPPADVAGYHPFSCTVDEMGPVELQGGAATRCLRFTSGPINMGTGPYEMHWTYSGDLQNGVISSPIAHGPMTQIIHYADGSTTKRPGGTYSFHVIHGHFHDDGVLDMSLFKVNDDGSLAKVGVGTKSGFCPANQLLGDWRSFNNTAPDGAIGSGDTGTGNCMNPVDGVLGLSPGWGDVYRWQRPGMYVDFGTNPDGVYVVRITIDKANDILESDETNNSAYALVKVVGDQAIELERGQGLSPFDPRKVVFTGSGPASGD